LTDVVDKQIAVTISCYNLSVVTPELLSYVREQLSAGVSRDQIQQTLQAQAGWSIEDLNIAFDTALTSVSAPNVMVATAQKGTLLPNLDDFNEKISDVSQSTNSYLWKQHNVFTSTVVIGSIVASVALLCFELFYSTQFYAYFGNDKSFFYVFLLPLAAPLIVWGHYSTKLQHTFAQQLATYLGFTYQPNGDTSTLSGQILVLGKTTMTDVISGTYDNTPIRIFNYNRAVWENQATGRATVTIFEWTTDTGLPDIMLSPALKHEAVVGPPRGYKALSLEGNFNTYFHLYIPENSQIDALQIFQPNIMEELIDAYKFFGIEFAGNKIYVDPRRLITNKEDFLKLLTLAQRIHDKVLPILQEMISGQGVVNS
jgi:hypothetical protein